MTTEAAPVPAQRDWALLLGGGQGQRAGGPKALKLVDGRPWWRLQCEAMLADGLAPVAVLHPGAWLGGEPPQTAAAAGTNGDQAAICAVPSDPAEPAFCSLLRGLQALPSGCGTWMLPVDCPWPGAAALQPLLPAIGSGSFWAVVPVARAADGRWRGGHPVWLSARAVAELRSLTDLARTEGRLDEWLRRRTTEVARIAVADAAVLANYNLDGTSR